MDLSSTLSLNDRIANMSTAQPPQEGEASTTAPPEIQLKIWELAWPSILGNLLFSIIGIISIKIVGSLGSEAVAAVTTGHRLFFAIQAILMANPTALWKRFRGMTCRYS